VKTRIIIMVADEITQAVCGINRAGGSLGRELIKREALAHARL
jgi:hypothetical protein